jgi:hypothetical protein
MSRPLAVRLSLLTVLVGGCAGAPQEHGGRLVAAYPPEGAPATAAAPYRADYALYREDGQALLWRGLAEKETVGFEKSAEGALTAVAGPDRVPLDDGRYCWRVTPETELRGAALVCHDTGNALASAGRFAGATALGVVLFPFVVLWGIPVSPFPS